MIGYLKVGLFCTCLALFLNVISAAIPYWWRQTAEVGYGEITLPNNGTFTVANSSVEVDYGAIRWCIKVDTEKKNCFSYSDAPNWLKASFAMIFVGIGSLTVSAILTVLFINIYTHVKVLCALAAWFSLFGAGADVASVVVFGAHAEDFFYGGSFYVAFGVPIAAIVIAIVSAILLFRYRNAEHKVV